MVQANEVRAAIARKNMTQSEVAKSLGISSKTLCARLKSGIFGSDEIDKLIDLLEISDPLWVFFGRKVT